MGVETRETLYVLLSKLLLVVFKFVSIVLQIGLNMKLPFINFYNNERVNLNHHGVAAGQDTFLLRYSVDLANVRVATIVNMAKSIYTL